MMDLLFLSEGFKKWSIGKPPEFNAFAYVRMIEERIYSDRLEF